MSNNFVDILGDNLDNIKTINNFLSSEEHSFLLNIAKKSEKLYNGESLHIDCFQFLDKSEFMMELKKINKKILKVAENNYNTKFVDNEEHGLVVHKINSFTDPHIDIIENNLVGNIPGNVEPEYKDWKDAWDGYLACNLYLNDDYEGGEVYFPERNYSFKPKANSLVTWPGNKYFIHGIRITKKSNRYVYGTFIKFADYDKYEQ